MQQHTLHKHVSGLCCLPALSLQRLFSANQSPKESKHCKKAEKNPLSYRLHQRCWQRKENSFLQEMLNEQQARPLRAAGALQGWSLSHVLSSHPCWQLTSQSPGEHPRWHRCCLTVLQKGTSCLIQTRELEFLPSKPSS